MINKDEMTHYYKLIEDYEFYSRMINIFSVLDKNAHE